VSHFTRTTEPAPPTITTRDAVVFALVPDLHNTSGAEPSFVATLVNLGPRRIERAQRRTGGFASDDDALTVAEGELVELGALAPGETLEVSFEGPGAFDVTVWWELELSFEGGELATLGFGVPRGFPLRPGTAEWRRLPLLEVDAWVVPAR
jgi:hypothetical protein